MLKKLQTKEFQKLCKDNDITYLGLFGSRLRGDNKIDSDYDFLVEYGVPVGYFKHAEVQNALGEYLAQPVDLVFRDSIKERLKPYILKEVQTVYE